MIFGMELADFTPGPSPFPDGINARVGAARVVSPTSKPPTVNIRPIAPRFAMNCGAIGYLGAITNHTAIPSLHSVSLYNPNMSLNVGMAAGVCSAHLIPLGAR